MTIEREGCVARGDADIARPEGVCTAFAGDARALVDRCLAGDDAAWHRLADQYWPICRAIAARILGKENASYAPDVAQDTFVVLLLRLNTWRSQSDESFRAWIGKLACSRALNFRRTHWLRRREIVDTHHRNGIRKRFDPAPWLLADMGAAKQRLPERQQHVFDGLEAGRTQREMAQALGVSRATIRKDIAAIRIHFGRIFGKMSEI
jgi:RNA polymerase sigma factor (sigma-70 family)